MWLSTIFVFALWLCSGPVSADDFQGGMKDGMSFYGSKNYSKTVKSIKKSADYGNAMAQYNLGLMYAKGDGQAQDYQQALFWFRKAADQGVGIAEFSLALLYDKGLGVNQDYPQAVSWYRKAAEHGYAMASYNLGVMYDSGDGVGQDYAQAVLLYRSAADQGLAQAQYNLAVMYESGLGVGQNFDQAAMWYRHAAEQGIMQAQSALSEMIRQGLVKPQDNQNLDVLPLKPKEQEIIATILQWAKAWSAKDVAGYLAFYAESFRTPAGVSFSDWKISRQGQIAKSKSIEVLVSDPQISFRGESHVVARFKQNYRSRLIKDVTAKTLILNKYNGKWLIESEEAQRF